MSIDTKFLDGSRFLFAMWVVVGHFYTLIGDSNFYKFPKPIEYFLNSGGIAVYGFVIITGFLMMYNYILREDREPCENISTFISFWLRRFFRLYPVYVIALLAAYFSFTSIAYFNAENLSFFTGTYITASGIVRSLEQPSILDLISHIFLIHGVIPAYHESILGVTWSLSLEMQFYFLFPFLYLLFFRNQKIAEKRVFVLLLFSTIISLLSPKLFGSWLKPGMLASFDLPSMITYNLPLFLLGMIMAAVLLKKLSFHFLIFCLIIICPFQDRFVNIIISSLLVFLFLDQIKGKIAGNMFCILLFIRNLLTSNLSHFGANISYSLYLMHSIIIPVVIRFIINYAGSILNKYEIALVSFVFSIALNFIISHVMYLLIEKQFIDYGRIIISKINNKTRNSKMFSKQIIKNSCI